MVDSVHSFLCPCCGKWLELNTRTGKARAADPLEAKGGQDLDKLLRAQKREEARLGDLFSSATKDEQQQAERLAAQLERAKQEAKKYKDEKPRNPFDLE